MAIKIGWGWKQLKGSLNQHKYLSSKNSWASWKWYNDMSNLKQKQKKIVKKKHISDIQSVTQQFFNFRLANSGNRWKDFFISL